MWLPDSRIIAVSSARLWFSRSRCLRIAFFRPVIRWNPAAPAAAHRCSPVRWKVATSCSATTASDCSSAMSTSAQLSANASLAESALNPQNLAPSIRRLMSAESPAHPARRKMDVHPYYGPGNVVVDTCGECGLIWLDHGEMTRVEQASGVRQTPWSQRSEVTPIPGSSEPTNQDRSFFGLPQRNPAAEFLADLFFGP